MVTKNPTKKQAIKKLDIIFSKYIRLRYATNGIVTCVTCGKVDDYKRMQCGHYVSRGKFGTRWDEQNCHVQCVGCNVMKNGNYTEYARFMIRTYGVDILDKLAYKSVNYPKFTTGELLLMIDEYKGKINQLKALDKHK